MNVFANKYLRMQYHINKISNLFIDELFLDKLQVIAFLTFFNSHLCEIQKSDYYSNEYLV